MGRCLVVWLLATAVALATWSAVASTVVALTSTPVWHGTFEDLLVAVASVALVVCVGWLWVVTTATVMAVARGWVPTAAPQGVTRRLVLLACGVAVVAGVGSPALADTTPDTGSGPSSERHSLVGLPMPDRAVVGRATPPAPASAPVVEDRPAQRHTPRATADPAPSAAPITVRAGDSLWSIAAAQLGPGADVAEIDAAWRDLYAANQHRIGEDADLILPGLDLEQGTTSNREARP